MSTSKQSADREILRMHRQERIKGLLEAQSLTYTDLDEMIHQIKKQQASLEAGKYDDIDDFPNPLDTAADEPATKRAKRSFDEYQNTRFSAGKSGARTVLPNQGRPEVSSHSVDDDLPLLSSSSQVDSASDYNPSTPGVLLGSDSSFTDPPSPTRTFPGDKSTSGSSLDGVRLPATGNARGLMQSVYASSSQPSYGAGTLLDPPEGRHWRPLTMNPMISHNGKIKTGDFIGEVLDTMLPEHCRTRSDWLCHLYHYGTIQLGHRNVDGGPCTIVAEWEIEHGIGLGKNGERLCPPEKFIFGFGKHRNKTLEQVSPLYVEQMYKAKENRPWLREAVELSRPKRTASSYSYQSSGGPSRHIRTHHQGPQLPRKHPIHPGSYASDAASFGTGSDDFVIGVSGPDHMNPDRLRMVKAISARSTGQSPRHTSASAVDPPSPLEQGQRTLSSAFTISKRGTSSTSAGSAPVQVMDLTE
ncbi:hypothetical protein ACET3X_004570 [Alternaria dauci]|uniref:Uncharacterized protein n=1 Tax=Alternaria dauci TaxID=48095 RepID=A0ABR3UNQ9_9PLEO